jgi:hypothetical protein
MTARVSPLSIKKESDYPSALLDDYRRIDFCYKAAPYTEKLIIAIIPSNRLNL